MALNLTRNTKVYFTTTTAGVTTGFTNANSAEIQVMEGYSLVQNTDTQEIQPNEAGATPIRGNRMFNVGLQPVDWSITTYIRPRKSAAAEVTSAEAYLWNALAGPSAYIPYANHGTVTTATRAATTATIVTATGTFPTASGINAAGDTLNLYGGSVPSWDGQFKVLSKTGTTTITYAVDANQLTGTTNAGTARASGGQWMETTAKAELAFENSNVQTLATFRLIFKIDNTYYAVDNCAIDNANIDFGIDQIAMIKWSGKGTKISVLSDTGGIANLVALSAPISTANFLTNKLSTVSLTSNIGGVSGTAYSVPLTAGNITISNNLTYLTPKILNTVNQPIGYYTGARNTNGTLNAYLRSGATAAPYDTGALWSNLLAAATASTETKFALVVSIGGSSNAIRVDLDMQGCFLQIPTLDVQDIVSTQIGFDGQGYALPTSGNAFDLEKSNDLVVRYFST